jgi:hypothetical protein
MGSEAFSPVACELMYDRLANPSIGLLPIEADGEKKERQPGSLRGSVIYMAPDFDEPLEDFREYME